MEQVVKLLDSGWQDIQSILTKAGISAAIDLDYQATAIMPDLGDNHLSELPVPSKALMITLPIL
jgi:hypothetical protein